MSYRIQIVADGTPLKGRYKTLSDAFFEARKHAVRAGAELAPITSLGFDWAMSGFDFGRTSEFHTVCLKHRYGFRRTGSPPPLRLPRR